MNGQLPMNPVTRSATRAPIGARSNIIWFTGCRSIGRPGRMTLAVTPRVLRRPATFTGLSRVS